MPNTQDKTVYIQVSWEPGKKTKSRTYLVNKVPFTDMILKPGKPIPVDKIYTSYDKLRKGLISEFRINPQDIPNEDYFEPTGDEIEYSQEPIFRVVPPEAEEMPWEIDAREAVKNTLEEAEWDFEDKTVTLYNPDLPGPKTEVGSLEDLVTELALISEVGSQNSMPWEGGPVFDLDFESIVYEELEEYRENIEKLGWNL